MLPLKASRSAWTRRAVLDIAAETVDGFSEDAENIVRDNAASLCIVSGQRNILSEPSSRFRLS
jgi:hypothetical protein